MTRWEVFWREFFYTLWHPLNWLYALIIVLGLATIAYGMTAVDGDTVKQGKKNYRLLGFDTPETFQSKCPQEKAKGKVAKLRLQTLILGGAVLKPTGHDCKYNRECAYLYYKGTDVADIMIREGLARPYHGERRKGWCN